MTDGTQARILIVDDDAANAELLARIFENEYDVVCVNDGQRALDVAGLTAPHVILLDVMMPGIDGFEVCSRLKSDEHTVGIPVIFITGMDRTDAETRGLELGAADYVTKPINPLVIERRVRNQVDLKRARDELAHLAATDGLTGIANRRHFDEALAAEYARHARAGAELSLVLLDIDHFKPFNDTYGHLRGDDCLRTVAQVLRDATHRPADLPARYGGEEFACILPETDLDGATAIAERIREGIAELHIPHHASPVADHVTASLGVATDHCVPGGSESGLLACADGQLYLAKQRGRNRIAAAEAEHPGEHH